MSFGLGCDGGRSDGRDSRMWKIRLRGSLLTKREVIPDGRGRGGSVVGSTSLEKESWCVYTILTGGWICQYVLVLIVSALSLHVSCTCNTELMSVPPTLS
jgi:hypothetical protein